MVPCAFRHLMFDTVINRNVKQDITVNEQQASKNTLIPINGILRLQKTHIKSLTRRQYNYKAWETGIKIPETENQVKPEMGHLQWR